MSRLAILDSTVLSNFALVKRSDLPQTLWPRNVCTSRPALQEYQAASDKLVFTTGYWRSIQIMELTEIEQEYAAQLPHRLGAGERSCLALAVLRDGLFVSDDLDARHLAQNLGLPVSGTLGILIACVRKNILEPRQANDLLVTMINAGYRSPMIEIPDRDEQS